MKTTRILLAFLALSLTPVVIPSHAEDRSIPAVPTEVNKVDPLNGKPVDPAITYQYEGATYAFSDAASRDQWKAKIEGSLYHKLGGKAAINAAVERFYVIMLADDRVKHRFDDVDMPRQRRKQKEFLSAAFGGPIAWKGKDMRTAHADMHLTETEFGAVAENLQKTLEELKVPKDLIAQVMAIAASTHDDVLNKPKSAAK